MEEKYNLLDVLKTIFKWKKEIFYTCLVAGVGSIIISFLLPIYYQSSTTFLVLSPDQTKPELLFGTTGAQMEYYGNGDDIDRILTLGESEELAAFMIDSFDLYNHYDIDQDNPKASYYIRLKLAKQLNLEKTSKDAIILTVEDKDKEKAAQMARAARNKINEIGSRLVLTNQEKTISIFERDVKDRTKLLREISDSLSATRTRYGVFNVNAQTKSLAEALAKAESKLVTNEAKHKSMSQLGGGRWRDSIALLNVKIAADKEKVLFVKEKLNSLNQGMSRILELEEQHKELGKSLSDAMKKLEQYNSVTGAKNPAIMVIEEAKVPVIKSKPQRKIIILATVIMAFVFSIIGVLVFDLFKDINWREIYNAK